MVNVLDRKLIRDLMRLKAQALTIALVVAVGVRNYITLRSAWPIGFRTFAGLPRPTRGSSRKSSCRWTACSHQRMARSSLYPPKGGRL